MLAQSLAAGLDQFLTPLTLTLTTLGVIFGLIVGALPGLGPLMGIVLMLLNTFFAVAIAATAIFAIVRFCNHLVPPRISSSNFW